MAPPRTRRDPGARRDDLVAAAARVVTREGVASATTRRIAEEAGVPLGTVHYWFSSKDELLLEVAAAHVDAVREAGRGAGGAVPGQAVEEAGLRLRAAHAADGSVEVGRRLALYELTLWALRSTDRATVARDQYTAMRTAARAVSDPWLDVHTGPARAAVDPEVFAAFVSAFFDGLALAELADPDGTRADEVLALFAEVIGTWATGGSAPTAAGPPAPG